MSDSVSKDFGKKVKVNILDLKILFFKRHEDKSQFTVMKIKRNVSSVQGQLSSSLQAPELLTAGKVSAAVFLRFDILLSFSTYSFLLGKEYSQ